MKRLANEHRLAGNVAIAAKLAEVAAELEAKVAETEASL